MVPEPYVYFNVEASREPLPLPIPLSSIYAHTVKNVLRVYTCMFRTDAQPLPGWLTRHIQLFNRTHTLGFAAKIITKST